MIQDSGRELDMRNPEQRPSNNAPTSLDKGVHSFARATSAPGAPTREAPAQPEIKKKPEVKKGLSKAARIGISTAAILGGIEGVGALVNEQVNQQPVSTKSVISDFAWPWNLAKSAVEDIQGLFFNKQKQILHEGTLAPQPGESVSWWQELPTEQIQKLAEIPGINMIGEQYVSAVNPALQEKAQQAGYEIIYQGDPNDTTGRTVVVEKRQLTEAFDDLGFGILGNQARGIFGKWVPDPNDPEQQGGIYAQLKDPITQKDFLVKVDLRVFDPNRFTEGTIDIPTFLYVDDLENGPKEIQEKSAAAGFTLTSEMLPDPIDQQSEKFKAPKNHLDMTFFELTRKKGLSLDKIAKPGDFIVTKFSVIGSTNRVFKDETGIPKAGSFIVRRFGGLKEWQNEVK